jgi:hypothetical protein
MQVSVPVTTMADCWRKIFDTLYDEDLEGKNATQKWVLQLVIITNL